MSNLLFEVTSSLPAVLTAQDLFVLARVLSKQVAIPSRSSVSLTCVSEARMQTINRQQRGKDRATDVLSFATAQEIRDIRPLGALVELGDLFLCPVYARREAKRRGVDEREELLRLIAHGVLHLQGYDHVTEAEEADMFGLQEQIVARVLAHKSKTSRV